MRSKIKMRQKLLTREMMMKELVKEMKMKRNVLILLALFVTVFIGCSNNENNITAPISEQILEKSNSANLPLGFVSITQEIHGSFGGNISIKQEALNSEGQSVSIDAYLRLHKGAFEGTENITMIINVDDATITFLPQMNFNNSCRLNVRLKNLNLEALGYDKKDKKVDFVYFDDLGGTESVPNSGTFINFANGLLRVHSAEINHFSRYGFLR
jgi:hypothetical protein